ncbi:MAG: hypothetical protein ABSH48_12550 [Verrucomicrobiota bacterium]
MKVYWKIQNVLHWAGVAYVLLLAGCCAPRSNVWTNPQSGKWEDEGSWSFGSPSNRASIYITNPGTKIVKIDQYTTSGKFHSTLSINDLTVAGTVGCSNILELVDAGTNVPLQVADSLTLGTAGGPGFLIVSNSALNAGALILGSHNGSVGAMTVQGNAVVNVSSNITLSSSSLTATSSITLDGGNFTATNGVTRIGVAGNGVLTVNGGTNIFRQIILNPKGTGSGGFLMHGGSVKIIGNGTGPGQGLVSNWVIFDGGDLDASGTSLTIGMTTDDSQVSIPPGASGLQGQLAAMYVGYGQNTGTFSEAGFNPCELDVSNQVVLGDCISGAIGNVYLSGGSLYVTNPVHTAALIIRNGTFNLSGDGNTNGGKLVVDNIYITNSTGKFVNNGGQLIVKGRIFATPPGLSACCSPGSVAISWPAPPPWPGSPPWPYWSLQTNSDVTNPNGWMADGVVPTLNGGTNYISVTPSATKLFFRLQPTW